MFRSVLNQRPNISHAIIQIARPIRVGILRLLTSVSHIVSCSTQHCGDTRCQHQQRYPRSFAQHIDTPCVMDYPVFALHLSSFVSPCHVVCNVEEALTTSMLACYSCCHLFLFPNRRLSDIPATFYLLCSSLTNPLASTQNHGSGRQNSLVT